MFLTILKKGGATMIIGGISDTHEDRYNAGTYILKDFIDRGVQFIVHCGDAIPRHMRGKYLGNLPAIIAMTDEQMEESGGDVRKLCPFGVPENWDFTFPGDRVRKIDNFSAYIGHKRAFEFLYKSEEKLFEDFFKIQQNYDNVRYLFSGHIHHQTMLETDTITFINPGAAEISYGPAGGHQYMILDTSRELVIFTRIQNPVPQKKTRIVGVVSGTLDVSKKNPPFWKKLAEEFRAKKVTDIIHCGNISMDDINHSDLLGFKVFCNLRSDQHLLGSKPERWEFISMENPMVKTDEYCACVQFDMGGELSKENEVQLKNRASQILHDHPETEVLLTGNRNHAFMEEAEGLIILNPGDVIRGRKYAIIEFPRDEMTFGRIQPDPLPSLS